MFTGSKYLKAVDERVRLATPGPWFYEYDENEGWKVYVVEPDGTALYLMQFSFDESSVKFTSAARTDIEVLSARVKELEGILSKLADTIVNNPKGSPRGNGSGSILAEAYTLVATALAATPPGEDE